MFTKRFQALPFLLPGLAGLILFYALPFVGGAWYSFTDGGFENKFIWFENYKSIWANPMFQLGLKNTMFFSLVCAPLVWALSFVMASLLNRIKPAGGFFRASVLMPYLMPSGAVLLIWLVLFDFGGPINRLVELLGGERINWLYGSPMRFPVIAMFVWKNLGFATVIFLAALQNVPEPLYEFARLEGCGFWGQMWHITLPNVVPGAFLVFVLCWINAFKIFKEAYFIGGAYPDESLYTLQNYMNNMFSKLNYQSVTTAAYTFALIVFLIFGALFLVQRRLLKRLEG